jgi:GAF domain-containing protein
MHFARRVTGATTTSLFMVDRGGKTLRGQVSDWDWTRTSFVSHLRDWPTVEQALADGKPHTISKTNARGSESVWFEPRGIKSTICVPMRIDERPLGILFFDFDEDVGERQPPVDMALLIDVGERCARAIVRPPAFAPNSDSGEATEAEQDDVLAESTPVILLE